MGTDLKAGVIGAGIMGAAHAREFNENPHTTLVGVADLDEAKADEVAEKTNTTAYYSAEDLLQKAKPDVVFIATPDPYHLAPLLSVLDAGVKHILLQKPFATSVEHAEQMAAAIEKAGARCFVTYGTRQNSASAAGKFITESGLIGEPLFASMRNVDNISVPREMWADRPDNWAVHQLKRAVPLLPPDRSPALVLRASRGAHGHGGEPRRGARITRPTSTRAS